MQLPEAFTRQMTDLLGEAEFETFSRALDEEPTVSVRPNPFKPVGETGGIPRGNSMVAWSSLGEYLDSRPSFTQNPLFHSGAFYVQEASSMFLEQALRQCGTPRVVLDLCAAPGGKSTLLRSLLPDDALLVCNEPVRSRAEVLAENITKWGHEGCVVTCNYPKDFAKAGLQFDLIAADLPCSGEGMFRKDNPALEMWSPDAVEECATRQRDIISAIWPTLRQGGFLIYSTCTYNTRENEENINYICRELGAEPVGIPVDPALQITGSLLKGSPLPVCRFLPHKTRGEGFFLCLLRKTSTSTAAKPRSKGNPKPLPKPWSNYITDPQDMALMEKDDIVYAVRRGDIALTESITKRLYILHAGLPLYEKKASKQIPCHALAMSRRLAADAFPRVELSREQALSYLNRQAITIDAPRGYILLTFAGLPLGFVNNLGNRANNMYPRNWKIKHLS